MATWTATDIGPRQAKRLNQAFAALRQEGQTYSERGSDGSEYSFYSPFGGTVNPMAASEHNAIGERFGWTVTKANLKAIEQAIAEALPRVRAARPVVERTGLVV